MKYSIWKLNINRMHPQCTERSYLSTSNSVPDKKIPPLEEKKDIFRQIKIVFHQGTLIKDNLNIYLEKKRGSRMEVPRQKKKR